DDLQLRRASGRCRDHAPGLSPVRAAGRERASADRRVSVRVRLPVVRAIAEVREPERAALEARRACRHGSDACRQGMNEKRRYASLIGPSRTDERIERLAYEVGAGLARAGFTLVTGGEHGAMGAASRGA